MFLLLSTLLWVDSIELSRWNPSLSWCGRPHMAQGLLFIEDLEHGRIHAFAIPNDLSAPEHLWATPGRGQGPGEIPEGSVINNFSLAADGALWVSHRLGITVYEADGEHRLTQPARGNTAWIIPFGEQILHTSPEPLFLRKILSRSTMGVQQSSWSIDYPQGIPVNDKGAFIESWPELHRFGNKLVVYDGSIGFLLVADPDGKVILEQQIPQTRHTSMVPARFNDKFRYGRDGFSMTRVFYPHVGASIVGNQLFLQAIHRCRGLRTEAGDEFSEGLEEGETIELRVLVALNTDTGEVLEKFVHPASNVPSYLVSADKQRMVFFDQEAGNKLTIVAREDMKPITGIIF